MITAEQEQKVASLTAKQNRTDIDIDEDTQAMEAARKGMYGKLTRKVIEWIPHKILCKRMNIPGKLRT